MLFIVHSLIKIFTACLRAAFDCKQMFHPLTAHLSKRLQRTDPVTSANHALSTQTHAQLMLFIWICISFYKRVTGNALKKARYGNLDRGKRINQFVLCKSFHNIYIKKKCFLFTVCARCPAWCRPGWSLIWFLKMKMISSCFNSSLPQLVFWGIMNIQIRPSLHPIRAASDLLHFHSVDKSSKQQEQICQ